MFSYVGLKRNDDSPMTSATKRWIRRFCKADLQKDAPRKGEKDEQESIEKSLEKWGKLIGKPIGNIGET